MSFDLSTAKPVIDTTEGVKPAAFDLSSARPVVVNKDNQTDFDLFASLSREATAPINDEPKGVWENVRESLSLGLESAKRATAPLTTGVAALAERTFKGVEQKVLLEVLKQYYRASAEEREQRTGKTFEEESADRPAAATIGGIVGGVAPYVAFAPLFPQSLLGVAGTFAAVGGTRELGRQEIEGIDDPFNIVKEAGKEAAYAPIWIYSKSLKIIGRPVAEAVARAGVRGAGSATVGTVFGDDLAESLKQGGMIMALSLMFESPRLAKTALGRQIVKEAVNKQAATWRAQGYSDASIMANMPIIDIDKVDNIATRKSIFKLVNSLVGSIRGRIKEPTSPPGQAGKPPTGQPAVVPTKQIPFRDPTPTDAAMDKMVMTVKETAGKAVPSVPAPVAPVRPGAEGKDPQSFNTAESGLTAEEAVKQGMSAEEWVGSKMAHSSGLKIQTPVIKTSDDVVFEGTTHSEAFRKAVDSGDIIAKGDKYFNKEGKEISIDWDLFRVDVSGLSKEKADAVRNSLGKDLLIDRLTADDFFGVSAGETLIERKSQLFSEYEKAKGATPPAEPPDKPTAVSPGEPEEQPVIAVIKESISKAKTKETVSKSVKENLQELFAQEEAKKEHILGLRERAKLEISNIKATMSVIKEQPEYSAMGEQIFPEKQEILKDLREQLEYQTDKLKNIKEDTEIVKTYNNVKYMLKKFEQGEKSGQLATKKEIKSIQDQVIEHLKDSDLDSADKGKFLSTIRNIQTAEQLARELPKIEQRIAILEEKAEKREIVATIKKEIKFTKPVKQGTKVVGKYDYTTNKLVAEYTRLSKLSQADAMEALSVMPDEGLTDEQVVLSRLLSYKANGAASSKELLEQVLADIQNIKRQGELSKNEEDFLKAVKQGEAVSVFIQAVKERKGDRTKISTKAKSFYVRSFANIYSSLNTIAGKNIAEKLDPERLEVLRNTNVYKAKKAVTKKTAKIYEIDEGAVVGLIHQMSVVDPMFELVDSRGVVTEISRMDLIDIYNSLKNELLAERYTNAFGSGQVQSVVAQLTEKDMAFGDFLQETVQKYFPILNKRSIEITGRDLGTRDNYWPATSEKVQSVLDDLKVQGQLPSAMKARTESSKVIPVPRNAWWKMEKHINEAEHVNVLSRRHEELMRILIDPIVKNTIERKFDPEMYRHVLQQVGNISLHKVQDRYDAINSAMSRMVNNWVKAKVSLNPSTWASQLMSAVNYSEDMPAHLWASDFLKGLSAGKDTFKYVWDGSDGMIEERFNRGYSEALRDAIRGAEFISEKNQKITDFMTWLTRSGDISAIIYGGYPYIKYLQTKDGGGFTEKEAFEKFIVKTLKAQQSGAASGRSEFQMRTDAATRLFLAFKNTSNQYLRKVVDATIEYEAGDITQGQLIKRLFIYLVVAPFLYSLSKTAVSEGTKAIGQAVFGSDPEYLEGEDVANRIFIELASSPTQAVPLLDDLVTAVMTKAITDKWPYRIVNTPLLDDLENAFYLTMKEDPDLEDYIRAFGVIGEAGAAIPVGVLLNTGKRLGLELD